MVTNREMREGSRSVAAARLQRLGTSAAMDRRLRDVYLARLQKERGLRASPFDRTLMALSRRGLVKGTGGDATWCLWQMTQAGTDYLNRQA